MGSVFSGMTAGFLISPIIAGIVYHNTGYFEVFILVLAVLAFDFILRATMIEKKRAAKWHDVEKLMSPNSEERAINEHSDSWSTNGRTDSAAKIVAQHGVIVREESDGEPDETSPLIRRISASTQDKLTKPKSWFASLFPKMAVLLSSPRLDVAVLGCFTHMIVVTSFDACLPLFAKRTFGWNSSGAGLIFLPFTLPALFGAAYGALSDRYGPKKVSLSGFGIATIFLALLALISDNTILHKVFLAILLVIVGIGVNLILTPLVADMFYESELLEKKHSEVFGKAGAYAQPLPHPTPLPTPLPSTFTLKAPPGTDIWRKPPSTSTFNAPLLYRSLPLLTFRRACVTVSADWRTLYDQGGLCLALPVPKGQNSESSKSERRWIKTGIEFYNGAPMVSTVACDRWADWSLLPLPTATSRGTSGGTSVTVGMEREVLEGVGGSTLCVYVMEGVEKRVVREVTWVFEEVNGEGEEEGELDGECWVGVYAAKPTKDEGDGERELSVEFGGLVVETF
ncbi:hypothetical protein OEA41_004546 [Lepraria neglecta]|uniref:Major facilitator superfamily (MFS) profile domain-containing protein n=1 Tax=Lepraria neglecta TaxID=209136 RepID=A0AAE0DG89_9LECA|nr:hypothetical protein OEA41_004546 [Lepraria neglecta]